MAEAEEFSEGEKLESKIKEIKAKTSKVEQKHVISGVMAAGLLVVVLGYSGLFLMSSDHSHEHNNTEIDYSKPGEDAVQKSDVEAAKTFRITDIGVAPASQKVKIGETVKFTNRIGSKVSISFDRSSKSIELGPGSSETLLITGITYFEVSGKDYSASGRVNVQ